MSRSSVASIVLIGDSITVGIVSEPAGPSYAELIEAWLAEDYGAYPLANVACGGTSSLDWHPDSPGNLLCPPVVNLYIDRVVPELPSEAATVLLGSNDAVGYFEPENQPVSVGDYAAALYAIVIDLLSDGVEYVVLMTAPRNYASQNPDVDLRLAAYREEVLQICSSDPMDGVLCGPDLYELLQPEHFASADVHPNAAGHLLIAEELYAVVPEPQRDVLLAAAILQLALLRALRGDKGISAVQPRYRHRHQAR